MSNERNYVVEDHSNGHHPMYLTQHDRSGSAWSPYSIEAERFTKGEADMVLAVYCKGIPGACVGVVRERR